MNKQELRRRALLRRDAMPPEEISQKSDKIARILRAHPYYKEAGQILIYASYKSEVMTQPVIRAAFEDGKRVFCPVVTGGREMRFYELDGKIREEFAGKGFSALPRNRWGIPEPDPLKCAQYAYAPGESLMVMPGCAYDEAGSRIGYGGGFYDTFLETFPMRTIALFFVCQKTQEAIPAKAHDKKPDVIIDA